MSILNDRMGKPDPGRRPTFAVVHDSGNPKLDWHTCALRTFEWQVRQKGTHSGYHGLFDLSNSVYALDPDQAYAYHARKAANPFSIGVMLGAGRPWAEVERADLDDLFNRVRIFVSPYDIEPRHATSLADAKAIGGYVGHDEIQAGKHDPGSDFPWSHFIDVLAS